MSPSASSYLPDLTGEFIDDGSLELLSLLGSGAYGRVYKALDTTSPDYDLEYYAVKCMPRYKPGSRAAQIQENELMTHRMITGHPRVISYYRQFETEDFVFVVLELAAGGDFFTALVDEQRFYGNPALIKKVFGELLDAVEYIHRNSVFHRDIKPENILCNSAGTDLRLADFGLATQVAVSQQFGCGSKCYMSPESIDPAYAHGCYSARHSDLWALSVIFTNMISRCHPWMTAELSDPGFAAFRSNNEYLLKALRITRPVHTLLKRCFHINPLRRPTLAQFRDAVNEIETFSLDDILPEAPVSPPPCLPMQLIPVAASSTLEWAVATPSTFAELETPRPVFPIQAPQPIVIQFSPFVIGSSSSSSEQVFSFPTPPPPTSTSASSSLPSIDSSTPSIDSSAVDSTPPTTPATSAVDPSDVRVSCIPALVVAHPPAPPPRAYLRPPRPSPLSITKPQPQPQPTGYHTVAQNARPTLPTRRKFMMARVLGRQKIEN